MKMEEKKENKGNIFKKENRKDKQIGFGAVIHSLALILVFSLVFFAVLIYVFNARGGAAKKAAEFIPYPAAAVGGEIITVGELDRKIDSVRMFYEKQDFSELGSRVDFRTDDGKKRLKIKEKYLLGKLIENKIIKKEAQKRGIKLTKDVVSQEVRRKIDQFGNEKNIREDLKNLYGWSLVDFEKNVVEPDMYKEKLLNYLRENDDSYKEAKDRISAAQKDLKEKMDFSEAVKKYSEGESAKNKGDLGWFSSEEMLSEISSAAFRLEKGSVSEIIESPLGYHIVRVDDKKTENEVEKIKVSQIFVRAKSIGDWLSEYQKNAGVYVFLKDFYWNESEGKIDFSRLEMAEFEKKMEEKSEGDISIMF